MAKVIVDWIDEKAGDRIAAELEAKQDAFDARVNKVMEDHEMFAEFVRDSNGEEYISDLVGDLIDRSTEMSRAYREYCETFMKEHG